MGFGFVTSAVALSLLASVLVWPVKVSHGQDDLGRSLLSRVEKPESESSPAAESDFFARKDEPQRTVYDSLATKQNLSEHGALTNKSPKISETETRFPVSQGYRYSPEVARTIHDDDEQAIRLSPPRALRSAHRQLEDAKRSIVKSLEENVKAGMRREAAMLASVFPMLQTLAQTPGLYGGSSILSDTVLGQSQCALDFERAVAAMVSKHLWAGQMFDAWGKLPPGVLKVFASFRGEFMECRDVHAPPILVSRHDISDLSSQSSSSLSSSSSSSSSSSLSFPSSSKTSEDATSQQRAGETDKNEALDAFREVMGISREISAQNDESEQLQKILHGMDSTPALLQMVLAGKISPDQLMERLSNGESLDLPIQEKRTPGVSGEKKFPFPAFHGKFCHIGISVDNVQISGGQYVVSNPPVVVGMSMDLCVPDSCSTSEVTDFWNHTFHELLHNGEAFGTDLVPIPATCQEKLPALQGKTIGILIFIVISMLAEGACTFYDVVYIQRPKWRLQQLKATFIAKRNELLTNSGAAQTKGPAEQRSPPLPKENGCPYADGGSEALVSDDVCFYEPELTTGQQFIQVFSLYTNGQRLLNTKLAPHTLRCVHGVRAISMAWIVMGHSVLYHVHVSENIVDFYTRERTRIYSMIITNGPFSVDTFFILSGIMVGYTFLEIYEAPSKLKWPVYVLYRFFRLSPSMVVVGALYICLWPAMGSGPVYPAKCPDEEVCLNYWYYSFFFVNTLIDTGRKCMGWTWYLSVDYQLYLLAPFLMVPIVRGWKRTGITIAVTTALFFVVLAGFISHRYKMAETLVQTGTSDGGPVNVYEVLNRLYYQPWCRVAPYITGLLMGHYFRVTQCAIRVPKPVVLMGWMFSIVAGLTAVFGMYESYSHRHLTTVLGAAIYNSVKDAGFSLAVAWVIFACVTGNGGFVNTILSWNAFIMVSRVTYCLYLVHIPMIFYFSFSMEGTVWWTESYLVINWLGNLCVSFMVATIVSVTTEAPSLRAQKLILSKMGFTVSG